MTSGFICVACGYLRDTPNHELGCLPDHNTKDRRCIARYQYEASQSGEVCKTCE